MSYDPDYAPAEKPSTAIELGAQEIAALIKWHQVQMRRITNKAGKLVLDPQYKGQKNAALVIREAELRIAPANCWPC